MHFGPLLFQLGKANVCTCGYLYLSLRIGAKGNKANFLQLPYFYFMDSARIGAPVNGRFSSVVAYILGEP